MLVSLRPPHAKPSPPTAQVLIQTLLDWLRDAPEWLIADMKAHDTRVKEAADLLANADSVRSELNSEISKLNARQTLLDGRESSLQKREVAVGKREAVIAVLRAELTSA
jgi:hypothetical protein